MFGEIKFSHYQWLLLPFLALLLSAVTTAWLIQYADKRRLLDQPGKRRSHQVPTPRGGGLSIVLAALSCGFLPFYFNKTGLPSGLIAIFFGSALVAAVGWWDDHHPLSAKFRFIIHVIAGVFFALTVDLPGSITLAVIVLSCAWSINLHNFMDGIDGFLGMQAMFVFAVMGFLALNATQPLFATSMFTLSAAVMGFLFFNFPRAKIFMGDVGSGSLGFLIAAFIWLGYVNGMMTLFEGLILTVAFVVDATCTLLLRMIKGRRWYRPHREHLYQWLVRTGSPHAQVVRWYLGWNIGIVIPILLLARHFPQYVMLMTGCLYVLAIIGWMCGKNFCLNRPKVIKSPNHATA